MTTAPTQVRPATDKDAQELAANMRESDVEETRVMTGAAPADVVPFSMRVSQKKYACRIAPDGPLLCIFGAADMPDSHGQGSCWELGTQEIDRHPRAFWDASRHFMSILWDAMPHVILFTNTIPASNQRSIRWLEALGAHFSAPIRLTSGLLVRRFHFVRKAARHV